MNKIIFFILPFFIVGCAGFKGHYATIERYNFDFLNLNCESDKSYYINKIKNKDDLILSANQLASLLRECKDYKQSNDFFDIAESAYKTDVDKKSTSGKISDEIGSALVNENVIEYQGFYYERVMTNIYKALNFMSLGDFENARVELNRAIERQRRSKQFYEKELQKARKNLQESSGQNKDSNEFNSRQIDNMISSWSNNLGDFEVLPDFINPFVNYIGGLFFYLDHDLNKSFDLIREALKMQPKNKQIIDDYKFIQKTSFRTSMKNNSKKVWIIYEDGLIMGRKEISFFIPFFIFDINIPNVPISLNVLTPSSKSFSSLKVGDKSTTVISNMDQVVKSEYKKRLPLQIMRTSIRAMTKAALQIGISSSAKEVGGNEVANLSNALSSIYSFLTNHADIRFLSSLPADFQALSIENYGQQIQIKTSNDEFISVINLPIGKNGIIYIKSISPNHVILHQIYR